MDADKPEQRHAAERLAASTTDLVHALANEPSLGLFYVCEHIQRSVPALVADKSALNQAAEQLRGVDVDAGFAVDDIETVTKGGTLTALSNTANLMAHSSVIARSLARQAQTR